MRKRVMISVALALLTVGTSMVALLLFNFPFTRAGQTKAVRQPPYAVHGADGVPVSTHRAFSMAVSEQASALLPWGMALDSLNGFIWVAEPGCEPKIKCPPTVQGVLGQYALSDGTLIQNFNEPDGYSSPLFVAIDKGGHIWFTQPDSDAIGEYNPQDQNWNQWFLKKGDLPFDLTFDKYGNLWFTDFGSNAIGFFNPRTQKVVENPTPTPNSNPYGMTVDPQGNIWFAENGAGVDQIASFTPNLSGAIKITEYAVGNLRPHLIAADQVGNIWYSGGFDGDVGEFNPRLGNRAQFVVYRGACSSPSSCTGTHISGIAVDKEGHVWFTDSLSQRVGYLIPSTGQVVARTIGASNTHPNDGLVIDGSERVWFTEEFRSILAMWPVSAFK
jgi:streptogramin lyase